MFTSDPLTGPFPTGQQLTDFRNLPGYAIEVALSDSCCSTAVAWTLNRLYSTRDEKAA